MLDVRLNGLSLRPILAKPPKITDQINAVCRTVEITVQQASGLSNYLGQPLELWYNGARWFYGFLRKRGYNSDGSIVYTAYDPLYFVKKNKDDFYVKNATATQGIKAMAAKAGVKVYSLANTKAVIPALYYQGAEGDKIIMDLIARAYKATGTKYWYRYRPDYGSDGLHLYERKYPTNVWAFQVGINLTNASYEESIEDTCTIIKLVNRETGKTVVKMDQAAVKAWGPTMYFEEVNKDEVKGMEKKAQDLLTNLAVVNTTMQADGINPNRVMPQFFSGDVIYVEEKYTRLIGAYFILNVVQTFESDNLVTLGFDLQIAPDIPVIQYDDATTKPETEASKAADKKAAAAAKKKGKTVTKAKEGVGVQEGYSEEMKAAIKTYGL